ncbi:hypothetical protein RSOLAG1IB_12619 [Rhizoctonia solani AG-1 IB]|uniref:Uncharacterized protein n=1 Tax=Thanatephorus cucumeris (strain AG1-IB / isolate 7/3/14) TaxID=1108050 RepID=A0A0B7G3A9_THACB|nr:hypothetical protein RSOLAG1IB_12619 [Rhizoctonia solani AG-1 IB]
MIKARQVSSHLPSRLTTPFDLDPIHFTPHLHTLTLSLEAQASSSFTVSFHPKSSYLARKLLSVSQVPGLFDVRDV